MQGFTFGPFSSTPVEIAPGVDIPGMMVRQSTEGEIRGYEKRREIPHLDMSGWTLGEMQRYRNYIGFWAPDVLMHMRGTVWDDDNGASLQDFRQITDSRLVE